MCAGQGKTKDGTHLRRISGIVYGDGQIERSVRIVLGLFGKKKKLMGQDNVVVFYLVLSEINKMFDLVLLHLSFETTPRANIRT